MLRSAVLKTGLSRYLSTMSQSETPIEDLIRHRIKENFGDGSVLIPRNDSHKHAHHVAMANTASKETHFHLTIVSDAFKGLTQLKRHRLVYAIFDDEMKREGGIHAMQLETRTHEEYEIKKKAAEPEKI